jgi:NADH-quinone oxidoreductase subunit L
MKINFKFLNPFKSSLKNNYGFDDFNEKYIAKGILKLGDFLSSKVDIKIIDDFLVNGSGRLVTYFANKLKLIQSGYIYHYAFFMIIGLFLLISFFVRT